MKNKDMPANPVANAAGYYKGLTKLEAFTLAAMQGIMANPNTNFNGTPSQINIAIENIAGDAVLVAKATLKELEKPS